jgi:hypothetical protein
VQQPKQQQTQTSTVVVKADTSNADKGIQHVKSELAGIDGQPATVTVDTNADSANQKLASVADRINQLNGMSAKPTLDMSSFDGAGAKVSGLLSMISQLNRNVTTTHTIKTVREGGEVLGTAHVRGTTAALSPAHADGTTSDGRLTSNQTALTSENG